MDKFKIGDRVIAKIDDNSIKTIIVGIDPESRYGLKYIVRWPSGWRIEPSSYYLEKCNMSEFSKRYKWISENDIKSMCMDCHAKV